MHGFFDDGKAQASTFGRGSGADPAVKGRGQAGQLRLWHARAMVAQAQQDLAALLARHDVHQDLAGAWVLAIAACVLQQVGDDAGQIGSVAQDIQILGHVEPHR